jgi:hypothetical protein
MVYGISDPTATYGSNGASWGFGSVDALPYLGPQLRVVAAGAHRRMWHFRNLRLPGESLELDRLVGERGTAPAFIRCDNGPELTANALREWCRFSRAGSAYIEPGSPWQNPYVESFGSRIRDELLAVELFSSLAED